MQIPFSQGNQELSSFFAAIKEVCNVYNVQGKKK